MIKIGIDAPVVPISLRPESHRASWPHIWANQLKYYFANAQKDVEISILTPQCNWEDFDTLYIYHGMEFNNKYLNLFGGSTDKNYARMARMKNPNVKLASLDIPMPDYGAMGARRILFNNCPPVWAAGAWDEITARCATAEYISQRSLGESMGWDHLALGDSHTNSIYTPGMMISRHDGQTLHGALTRGLDSFITPFGSLVRRVSLYFGNIDIRFHLMRQPDPHASLNVLLREYELQICGLNMEHVELIGALPIENPSRKMTKSFGEYKGQSFFGEWHERVNLVALFNARLQEMCTRNGWNYYAHPAHVFKNDIGELDFAVMERPKGVHLSRKYYRWDLINDCPNALLNIQVPNVEKPRTTLVF